MVLKTYHWMLNLKGACHSPWWQSLGLLSWCPICKLSHCNSLEDWALMHTGIILCMRPANEGWRYIGGTHTKNDPWNEIEGCLILKKKSYRDFTISCIWQGTRIIAPVMADMLYFSCHGACCYRAESRFAPSQWETVLLCNNISHWLGAGLESAPLLWNKQTLIVLSCCHKPSRLLANDNEAYKYGHVMLLQGFFSQWECSFHMKSCCCHLFGLTCDSVTSRK